MCITESLCCTADWHNIVNQLYYNKKRFQKIKKGKSLPRTYYVPSTMIDTGKIKMTMAITHFS